ncbi:HAMP domain-containing histidine kinase [Candidatus Chloroploca sp. M-50]|uniref:histidine kinase n=1 Tax=Candidatus Chloroploca mongolica TaxID=2528176 RepID=A0ABS4DA39_9CHLR|nr:HAMP domain-containing sensor histidine kinase [Candidatus Chloroploca mongolica]MBP1466309.1 HAMP domain-containing histidine kinase [Candidatus Chloroploca mongolica]
MPLTFRLVLTYLFVTLVGLLLVGGGLLALTGRYLETQRVQQLQAQTAIYAALLGELAATPAQLQALASPRPGADLLPVDTQARLFSATGVLLYGDAALGPFPSRPVLSLIAPPFPLPASQVQGRHYAASPINGAEGPIGVVELSRETTAETRLLAALSRLVVQATLVAALVMSLVSVMVARGLVRPIARLTGRAEALAASYGAPVGPPDASRSRDELVALTQSLDRLEAGVQAYHARIQELEQMRAHFYRSLSHELRTPLTVMATTIENLAEALPDAQRQNLALLESETARLGRLVDDLLRPPDDGRLRLLARTPVDLGELATEVVTMLMGRARRAGVTLTAVPSPASLNIAGDRDRLKQALLNLVDNAIRVTPPGGAVSVQSLPGATGAQVLVKDTGPGVPEVLRERIWQRGIRGDDPATDGSAGLGLALVREIAEAHGGRAWLEGTEAPGACFGLEVPY